MRELNTADLQGRSVIDNEGTTVGQVADIALDSETWRVRGLIVDVEREVAKRLNLERRAQLQLSPERIGAMGENVILNVNTSDLAGLLISDRD